MAKNLSQQMTDFMKNYRAAQDQAKTFEGMHNQLSSLLQNSLENNTNNTNNATNASNSASEKPASSASWVEKLRGLNQAIKDYSNEMKNGAPTQPESDEDTVEYTYKPGDTFGQVILDLGLNTDNGLWGDNGDVNYYTQQLVDQGIWEDNQPHNIPIGTTIKLRRRGAETATPETPRDKFLRRMKELGFKPAPTKQGGK